jgi:hypothetical protein
MLDFGLGGTPSSPELGFSPMIGVRGGGGGQGTKRTIEGEGKTEEDAYDNDL